MNSRIAPPPMMTTARIPSRTIGSIPPPVDDDGAVGVAVARGVAAGAVPVAAAADAGGAVASVVGVGDGPTVTTVKTTLVNGAPLVITGTPSALRHVRVSSNTVAPATYTFVRSTFSTRK